MKNEKVRMFFAFLMTFVILIISKSLDRYFNDFIIMIAQGILLFGVFIVVIPNKSK